jgi:hypothetical protein
VARGLPLSLPLGALAASVALAGCGTGSRPATESTHSPTVAATATSSGARAAIGRRQPGAQPLTAEEMREYDANEGRCDDDGGGVRDVGTLEAYCAFPARANDFHLIESSHEKEPAGEEE